MRVYMRVYTCVPLDGYSTVCGCSLLVLKAMFLRALQLIETQCMCMKIPNLSNSNSIVEIKKNCL